MKTVIAVIAVVASVSSASAIGVSQNDIHRFVTPNQIAQLSSDEVRKVQRLISAGASQFEIRDKVQLLLN